MSAFELVADMPWVPRAVAMRDGRDSGGLSGMARSMFGGGGW